MRLFRNVNRLLYNSLNIMEQESTSKLGSAVVPEEKPLDIFNWRPEKEHLEPYLYEKNMDTDPFKQFDTWFREISQQTNLKFEEINAVALSTVKNNRPSCRMVLLKRFDHDGFTFYTNYGSRKGQELNENPYACMLFYWSHFDRQIRIEGEVENLPIELADAYWNVRPLPSRIGSKISHQSTVVPSREYLDDQVAELTKLAEEKGPEAITRPQEWGGYILKPTYFEFWQGQTNRVHDRIVYERADEKSDMWTMKRLSP